jgi:membrane protein
MASDEASHGAGAQIERARGWFATTFPGRAFDRFSAIDGKTRALVIAGQAFTSLIPLFILVASVGGDSRKDSTLADSLVQRFHVTGSAADAVRELFTRPPGATGTLGIVSFVILLFSLLSLTRALQGVFEAAWGFKPSGFRGTLHGLSGTSLLITEVIVLTFLASVLRGAPAATFLNAVIRLIASFVLWLGLQWLLLSRRVPWRELRRAAVLATIGQTLFSFGSSIYMPDLIAKDAGRYGIIGVTLALISWLIALSIGIVIIAVVGAELSGTPALDREESVATPEP